MLCLPPPLGAELSQGEADVPTGGVDSLASLYSAILSAYPCCYLVLILHFKISGTDVKRDHSRAGLCRAVSRSIQRKRHFSKVPEQACVLAYAVFPSLTWTAVLPLLKAVYFLGLLPLCPCLPPPKFCLFCPPTGDRNRMVASNRPY